MTPKDLYEQFLNETGFNWVLISENGSNFNLNLAVQRQGIQEEWWWYDVKTPGGIVCVDFIEDGIVEISSKSGSYISIPFQRISISDPNCFETIERILRGYRPKKILLE